MAREIRLTAFRGGLYDLGPPIGSSAIPTQGKPSEVDRLERAVEALAERYRKLRVENARLSRELSEGNRRVAEFEAQVRELNQRRRDVAKRLDDLIGQIDHLEAQFSARSA